LDFQSAAATTDYGHCIATTSTGAGFGAKAEKPSGLELLQLLLLPPPLLLNLLQQQQNTRVLTVRTRFPTKFQLKESTLNMKRHITPNA